MIHYRQRLREKVVEILKAADMAGINDRVFGRLFVPFRAEIMPCVSVYSDEEKLQKSANNYDRLVTIVVKLFIAAGIDDDTEDKCDDYCAQIETRIDATLGGLALNGALADVRLESNGEGNQQYMTAELTFWFRYGTAFNNPTTSTH